MNHNLSSAMVKIDLFFYLVFFLFIHLSMVHSQKLDTFSSVYTLPLVKISDSAKIHLSLIKNVYRLTSQEMKEMGSMTAADALSRMPGNSQLHTGAISKPVIRGLYGSRLQVNLGGIKVEDQQWEDEQGLELSDAGIKRIEVIKGAAALMYGPEAIGGVINIIDEEPDTLRPYNSLQKADQNLNLEMFSNTYGIGIEYTRSKKTSVHQSWYINASAESHADYSDGLGVRVPNTRFALYNFKLAQYYSKCKWTIENKLYTSFNQFGFTKDSADFGDILSENRLSRDFEEEHHNVLSMLLSSHSTCNINLNTKWENTIGLQSNIRQEQEGEQATELGLALNTINIRSMLRKTYRNDINWNAGISSAVISNVNFGSRIIIPNATTFNSGLFTYFNKTFLPGPQHRITIESGVRYDIQLLNTSNTFEKPGNQKVFDAFQKTIGIWNYSIGGHWSVHSFLMKIDLSTGFRFPNLAELFSNGKHEGMARWDLGDKTLKNEQGFNKELYAEYDFNGFILRGAVFSNNFKNYVFLSPTADYFNGYPLYRYQQSDATFTGFESGAEWYGLNGFRLSADYSNILATQSGGTYLPFIPANRWIGKIQWLIHHASNTRFSFHSVYTAPQTHVYQNEQASPSYWLHSFSISTNVHAVRFILTCNNLSNTYYNDHLSLLRLIGLRDMGRNVILNIGYTF